MHQDEDVKSYVYGVTLVFFHHMSTKKDTTLKEK